MRKVRELAQPSNGTGDRDVEATEALKNGGSPPGQAILEEIFYISSKRNTLYRVRLTERGLTLRKESNCGPSKTETILVDDIVGCR
jgi:hypothetical protein